MPADHVTIRVEDQSLLAALDRLERVLLTREIEHEMHAVTELGKQLLERRVPRRTGRLAAGWSPKVTVKGGEFATIEASVELQPQVFYGRFQDTGWRYHAQGLHFIEKTEAELEPVARRVVDDAIKRAIKQAGL